MTDKTLDEYLERIELPIVTQCCLCKRIYRSYMKEWISFDKPMLKLINDNYSVSSTYCKDCYNDNVDNIMNRR